MTGLSIELENPMIQVNFLNMHWNIRFKRHKFRVFRKTQMQFICFRKNRTKKGYQ
jgi:hypothetical protein